MANEPESMQPAEFGVERDGYTYSLGPIPGEVVGHGDFSEGRVEFVRTDDGRVMGRELETGLYWEAVPRDVVQAVEAERGRPLTDR